MLYKEMYMNKSLRSQCPALGSENNISELSFFTGRGVPSICGQGPDFFGVVKGGTSFFFQWAKVGDQHS